MKLLGNELNIIPILTKQLSSKSEGVVMEAVLCLKNISSNEDNSTKIGKLRGLELLLHTINTTKSENLKKVCALTIQALAKNRKYLILDLACDTSISKQYENY